MADDADTHDDDEDDDEDVVCPNPTNNPRCWKRFTPLPHLKGKRGVLCASCHDLRRNAKAAGGDAGTTTKGRKKMADKRDAGDPPAPKKGGAVKNALETLGTWEMRRLTQQAIDGIPEALVSAVRRTPMQGRWLGPALGGLSLGLEQTGLVPPPVMDFVRDGLVDTGVAIQQRLAHGAPVTPEQVEAHEATIKSAKDAAAQAKDFPFKVAVTQRADGGWDVGQAFHHPACPELPEPRETKWGKGNELKVAGVKHRDVTHHQATSMGLAPCDKCKALVAEQAEQAKKAEEKAKEKTMTTTHHANPLALFTKEEWAEINKNMIQAYPDPAIRAEKVAFLVERFDASEEPIVRTLTMANRTVEDIELVLAAIKKRRDESTFEKVLEKGKDAAKQIAAAFEEVTGLDQGLGTIVAQSHAARANTLTWRQQRRAERAARRAARLGQQVGQGDDNPNNNQNGDQ